MTDPRPKPPNPGRPTRDPGGDGLALAIALLTAAVMAIALGLLR